MLTSDAKSLYFLSSSPRDFHDHRIPAATMVCRRRATKEATSRAEADGDLPTPPGCVIVGWPGLHRLGCSAEAVAGDRAPRARALALRCCRCSWIEMPLHCGLGGGDYLLAGGRAGGRAMNVERTNGRTNCCYTTHLLLRICMLSVDRLLSFCGSFWRE